MTGALTNEPPAAATAEGSTVAFTPQAASGGIIPPTAGAQSPTRRRRDTLRVTTRDGRAIIFTGKAARVLAMMAAGQSLTPHDVWRWHTRLAASVCIIRKAGLAVATDREGDARHARYRLTTPVRIDGGLSVELAA